MSDENLTNRDKLELAIQSGLQIIPYVGPSISEAYFGYKQEKRFKRIESFYKEFSEEIEEIKSSFLPMEFHNNNELMAIIEEFNEALEREHTEEKRKYLKNYLKHTLSIPVIKQFDRLKFFLDALSQMTLLDCEVLAFLSQEGLITVGTISKPGVDQYAIIGSIGKLKSLGFLEYGVNSMTVGGGTDQALQENVKVSPFGMDFIQHCLKD